MFLWLYPKLHLEIIYKVKLWEASGKDFLPQREAPLSLCIGEAVRTSRPVLDTITFKGLTLKSEAKRGGSQRPFVVCEGTASPHQEGASSAGSAFIAQLIKGKTYSLPRICFSLKATGVKPLCHPEVKFIALNKL
jgi:hypothetical protein